MIALSSAVYQEIAEVIARPKFARILSSARQLEILEFLSAAALWFEAAETVTDCRDCKENRYLELAAVARATVLVSGDSDLLVLHPWRGIGVLKPAAFIALFSTD